MVSRRQFVRNATLVALAGCQPGRIGARGADRRSAVYPFTLGVASGDPTAGSIVLWTRLAPEPLNDTSLAAAITVSWVLAKDPELRHVVRSGRVLALPENAHCVHVDADQLAAGSVYYYRFEADGHKSPVGRTRTLPAAGADVERFTIALASCMEYSQGYFTAYRDFVDTQPDLVIHNGDYIYEAPSGKVRPYPVLPEARTLADYRALYAQYRQDADLRAAHAQFPWIVIWDDHEVVNDWGPQHYLPSSRNEHITDDQHRVRQRHAAKAFLEHMPLRASMATHAAAAPQFYERNVIGNLLELSRLDVRSYRDRPVCNENLGMLFVDCDAAHDPSRSMLGEAQEKWLYRNFGTSGCQWNCLVQSTVMAPFDRAAGQAVNYETDGWDNYAANRARLVEHIDRQAIRNCVALGANIHAFYAGKVPLQGLDEACRSVLTEVVTTSITASGGGSERYDDIHGRRDENPCMDYFDNRYHGYALLDFSHERITVSLQVVNDIEVADSAVTTLARLVVDDGAVGVRG